MFPLSSNARTSNFGFQRIQLLEGTPSSMNIHSYSFMFINPYHPLIQNNDSPQGRFYHHKPPNDYRIAYYMIIIIMAMAWPSMVLLSQRPWHLQGTSILASRCRNSSWCFTWSSSMYLCKPWPSGGNQGLVVVWNVYTVVYHISFTCDIQVVICVHI